MVKREDKATTDRRDIFISYSSKDKKIAEKLRQAVNSLQYTAFFDEVSLPGSPEWSAEIARSINNCRMVLFYRTDNSVASEWCARELRIAEQSDKPIVPVVNRSKQNALPDSDDLQALLINRQNTFIDEDEAPSSIRENLRQTLENMLGKGTGNFGEISSVLHDMLRQAAAAMNITLKTDAVQYSYDGPECARLYRDFWFGDRGVQFQMAYHRKKNFRSFGSKCEKQHCAMRRLCRNEKKGMVKSYVIDTSVKYFGPDGYLADAIDEKLRTMVNGGNTEWGFYECPRIRKGDFWERLIVRDEPDFGQREFDSYSAVLRMIFKARSYFAAWEKILADLRNKATMWDDFLGAFQNDKMLQDEYSIYKEGRSLQLVPKKPTSQAERNEERLGIYDSIELTRSDVIRICADKLYSSAPAIDFSRFRLNQVATAVFDISEFANVDDLETGSWENSKEDLMTRVRNLIRGLREAPVKDRKSWKDEERSRRILNRLINELTAMQVGDWKVTSDHAKNIFTAIGKYKYAKTANDPADIISPLRIKIVINRAGGLRAGFVVFHVDEPSEPKFDFEPSGSGKGGSEEKAPEFRWYFPELSDRKGSNPQRFSAVIGESEQTEAPRGFVQQAVAAWKKLWEYINDSGVGKSTLSARRNGAYKKLRGYFKKQGGFFFTSLDGRTVEGETDGDRIAWLLQMDHRFYRDFSKVAGAPIPFCPFVQFIGPGMGRWMTGWNTTREFRDLPRSVKHFFWHSIFGKNITIAPNGDSVSFDRHDDYSVKALGAAMVELEGQKEKIAYLWKCLSDPEFSKTAEISLKSRKETAKKQFAENRSEDREKKPAPDFEAVSNDPGDRQSAKEENE